MPNKEQKKFKQIIKSRQRAQHKNAVKQRLELMDRWYPKDNRQIFEKAGIRIAKIKHLNQFHSRTLGIGTYK